MSHTGRWIGRIYVLAVAGFSVSPLLIVIVLSFGADDFVVFPPTGFSLRWYGALLRDGELARSLALSVEVAAAAAVIGLFAGVPAALALDRARLPGRGILQAIALSPLLLPEVLIGLALLQFILSTLETSPSFLTLVAAHAVLVFPFIVQFAGAALVGLNPEIEDAARTLGARPGRLFAQVTLPAIAPSVAAGALFGFIFSFDNVAISLFLASPGATTLPVTLYERATYSNDPSLAAAAATLIYLGLGAAVLLRRFSGPAVPATVGQ